MNEAKFVVEIVLKNNRDIVETSFFPVNSIHEAERIQDSLGITPDHKQFATRIVGLSSDGVTMIWD